MGLKREDIPLGARIFKVADVFDALSSRRSYKEPWPYQQICEEFIKGSGAEFDPQVVEAFLKIPSRGLGIDKHASYGNKPNVMQVGTRLEISKGNCKSVDITFIKAFLLCCGNSDTFCPCNRLDDPVHLRMTAPPDCKFLGRSGK